MKKIYSSSSLNILMYFTLLKTIICENSLSVILIILCMLMLNQNKFKSLKKLFKKDKNENHSEENNNEEINLDEYCRFEETIGNNDNENENEKNIENIQFDKISNIKPILKKSKKKSKQVTISPYKNDRNKIQDNYLNESDKYDFNIKVNQNLCSTPIFNLRTHKDIDFHFNFLLHNFNPEKINNLIMCKDIHQWMTSSSISSDDLNDELIPVYFIKKENDFIDVYEYLKIFISTDKNDVKNAFVQKGDDFMIINRNINELIKFNLIKDLLNDEEYLNYNLSTHAGITDFLDNFLSLVLISDKFVGDKIELDIEDYNENKKTFEYFFNTINSDVSVFNTTI